MIQLQTLGALDLRRDGAELRSVLLQPKRLALLVYLATAEPRGFHSRDTLLALFWPDAEPDRARNALRQAVHYLRRSLGDDVLVGRGDRDLGIDGGRLGCDAAAFDDAVRDGRAEDALALYRGEFMPGFFIDDALEAERWLEAERGRRRRAAVDAAWSLVAREEQRGEVRAAVSWARRAVALDPHAEAGAERLATLLHRAGDPGGAVETLEEHARRVREDLELEPSAELRSLAERLRAATVAGPARSPGSGAALHAPPPGGAGRVPVAPAPGGGAPLAVAPSRGSRARVLAAVALTAVTAAAGASVVRGLRPLAGSEPPSIAVLPFVNMSGDPENEYFSDGMTEELLNALVQVDGLRVAARTSSFAFKGSSPDVREVGSRLRVATVLEGSVRKADGRVKVTAQLIDARTGYHLWSETYDRELSEVFTIQEEISRAIVAALELRLGGQAERALARLEADPEVYDLYLRGRYLISRTVEERNRRAVAYFEEAIRRDPGFAPAHAGLARALIAMSEFVPPRDVLPAAKRAALDALALDGRLVETRLALAEVRRVYDRDWRAAEAELRRAIALEPGSAAAHAAYAEFLLDARRFDASREERERSWALQRARAPDPLAAALRVQEDLSWGSYLLRVGRCPEAIARAKAALELDPRTALAHWMVGFCSQQLGRHAEAIAAMERAHELAGGALPFLSNLGHAYALAGRRDDALAILDTLHARARSRYVPKDQIALLHFALGDTTSAFEWLEAAVDDYHWWLPAMNAHPVWDGARRDPRFQALMRRLGAPVGDG